MSLAEGTVRVPDPKCMQRSVHRRSVAHDALGGSVWSMSSAMVMTYELISLFLTQADQNNLGVAVMEVFVRRDSEGNWQRQACVASPSGGPQQPAQDLPFASGKHFPGSSTSDLPRRYVCVLVPECASLGLVLKASYRDAPDWPRDSVLVPRMAVRPCAPPRLML